MPTENFYQDVLPTLITAASTIIVTLISGFISVGIANSKQKKLLESLINKLGFNDDEASLKRQLDSKLGNHSLSISEQLNVGTKSVSEQLGVGNDDKSLTGQHKEIISVLEQQMDSIATITAKFRDEQNQRESLNHSEQNILNAVELLVEQWKTNAAENNQLKERISQLDNIILELRSENANLKEIINEYEASEQDNSYELER